jgi:ubiquinol-cytochrome c reductase cytochrome b subunit
LAAVLFFVVWKGTSLTAPADTARSFDAARPDWYFMSLFTLLKFKPFAGEFGTMLGAVLVPGLVATVFFMMPFIGRLKVGHWFNVLFLYLFLGGFVGLTAYGFYKDSKDTGYHADLARAEAEAERVEELIVANKGIPPEGALALYQSDPLTHGPTLYAQNCASCHPFGGHDGTGEALADEPSAADLENLGSRQWIADLLTLERYQSVHYFGNTAFKDGEMAEALDEYGLTEAGIKDEESTAAADIEAISTALAFEAGRKGFSADPELVKSGFFLMEDDDEGLDCASCHKIRGSGSGKGPDLTGYMSREWLMDFIGNPAHERFYGEDNDRMPTFLDSRDQKTGEVTKGKLDEKSVGLIVDWLRGEWLGAE